VARTRNPGSGPTARQHLHLSRLSEELSIEQGQGIAELSTPGEQQGNGGPTFSEFPGTYKNRGLLEAEVSAFLEWTSGGIHRARRSR
jgi:hypothetical protein